VAWPRAVARPRSGTLGGIAVGEQGWVQVGTEQFDRGEALQDMFGPDLPLERAELGAGLAAVDHPGGPAKVFINAEDQDRELALDRPVVLHFGERELRPVGDVTITMGIDPQVGVSLVNPGAAVVDGVPRVGRKTLHEDRLQAELLADVNRRT